MYTRKLNVDSLSLNFTQSKNATIAYFFQEILHLNQRAKFIYIFQNVEDFAKTTAQIPCLFTK